MGSLSPPPCFLKEEALGLGFSRASCSALSNLSDRAVCLCCIVMSTASGGVEYPGLSSLPASSWSIVAGSSLGRDFGVGSVYFPSDEETGMYWGDGE